jgi:hypothetical protein
VAQNLEGALALCLRRPAGAIRSKWTDGERIRLGRGLDHEVDAVVADEEPVGAFDDPAPARFRSMAERADEQGHPAAG